MYTYDKNNLLLRRMVVALMVSRTQPSSATVPALATTVLGSVAALVAMAFAAEPWMSEWPRLSRSSPPPGCAIPAPPPPLALPPRLCRHGPAAMAVPPRLRLCRYAAPPPRRHSSAVPSQASPSSPRLRSSGLRWRVRGGVTSPDSSPWLCRRTAYATLCRLGYVISAPPP